MKNLVIVSDLHCGSIHGLTPPGWYTHQSPQHLRYQKETWNAYRQMTRNWGEPDVLLVNGDCIEGTQGKQSGAELITTDRNQQVQMACKALSEWNAKETLMTYGTAYHVGSQAEDFEYNIAQNLSARIEGHLFFKIEDLLIDARHYLGSSFVPQGRATALLRDVAWNLIKSSLNEEPRANVWIRSHVHYHVWIEQPQRVMFTTPALQLARGRFGSRQCIGEVHWGAIRLGISGNQIVEKEVKIWNLKGSNAKIIRIR